MPILFENFSEILHGEISGGKAKVLASLFQQGYSVPEGFIITCADFDEMGITIKAKNEASKLYHQMRKQSLPFEVAVRSSSLDEDSTTASYAGQFETILNVKSEKELYLAINTVFSSLNKENVKSYSKANKIDAQQGMAIIVQRMLSPDFSGVMFTVDPVSSESNIIQGNVTKGLGDKLVSGETTGDIFTIHKITGEFKIPEYLQPYQGNLFNLAQDLESKFQSAQDIEWAIEAGKLFLLQCRPVTNLSTIPDIWNDSLNGDYFWTNTNLEEAMGGILTPLSASAIKATVNNVVGLPLFGLIGSRLYLNISMALAIFDNFHISRNFSKKVYSPMFGPFPAHVEIPKTTITFKQHLHFSLQQSKLFFRYVISNKKYLKWIIEECPDWCNQQFKEIKQCQSNSDIVKHINGFNSVRNKLMPMLTITTNMLMMLMPKLESTLSKLLTPEEVEVMLSGLGGNSQLASMGPLLALSDLVKGKITQQEFSQKFGHRGPREFELSMPRSGEDPQWIKKLISQWDNSNPQELILKQQQKRDKIWSKLKKFSSKKAHKVQKLFMKVSTLTINREHYRSEATRMAWVARKSILRTAEINNLTDELFYLYQDELESFLLGDKRALAKVSERKKIYNAYAEIPRLPNIISGQIHPFQWFKNPNSRTDIFDSPVLSSNVATPVPTTAGMPSSRATMAA